MPRKPRPRSLPDEADPPQNGKRFHPSASPTTWKNRRFDLETAIRHSGFSSTAKLLWRELQNNCWQPKDSEEGKRGRAYAEFTNEQLAKNLDRCTRTITRCVDELNLGKVIWSHERFDRGWQMPNRHYFLWLDLEKIRAITPESIKKAREARRAEHKNKHVPAAGAVATRTSPQPELDTNSSRAFSSGAAALLADKPMMQHIGDILPAILKPKMKPARRKTSAANS
jgi:hypothetical protein